MCVPLRINGKGTGRESMSALAWDRLKRTGRESSYEKID